MTDLLAHLGAAATFVDLAGRLAEEGRVRVAGVWGSFGPLLVAGLADPDRSVLYLTDTEDEAIDAADDLDLLLGEAADEILVYPSLGPNPSRERLHSSRRVLARLADGRPTIVTATAEAAARPVPTPEALGRLALDLAPGFEIDPADLVERLIESGFDHVAVVEYRGEVSRRGGIVDVFPHDTLDPVRIEFFGDEVESLRTFEVGTQRSIANRQRFVLYIEPPPGGPTGTLLDHFGPESLVVLAEPEEMQARLGPGFGPFYEATGGHRRIELVEFGTGQATFDVTSPEHAAGDLQAAVRGLGQLGQAVDRLHLFCGSEARAERMERVLAEEGLEPGQALRIEPGRLSRGFLSRSLGLAAVAFHELFGKPARRSRRGGRARGSSAPIDDFLHLSPGDFVVHLAHGIGRYRGIGQIERDGQRQEFLKIEYRGASILHVPTTQTDLVHKYVGARGQVPSLDKLGGKSWAGKMAKVAESLRAMADEILEVQALRAAREGHAFEADDWLQREFEAAFEFEETDDQIKVADEVAGDMIAPRPMDRLVCGDVGYGKTEIAVRAAFRASRASKQTAVLVPTTILAEQHFRTFSRRMADYPVAVECLSRFRSRKEQKAILERLASGAIDVIVGTHRLLSEDVRFADLGLLVVDEEQRFGVRDKERLKRIKKTVDCLTLSATPIPRTLHMALLGIRDISDLATPPPHRRPVATLVTRWDSELVTRVLEREFERGGQVYFLHNRIADIEAVADRVADLAPAARLVIGHGRMEERQLEDVIRRFVDGEADLLVSTAIIENGLDIPNANTILINRADRFGLSDLHQLRGRVGRQMRQAYCVLLVPEHGVLTPESRKRLKAIQDYQELGAGFHIAMRDLEIRGAGNILGAEQSGHIATVGYDIYTRLLRRTVAELSGEEFDEDVLEPGPMIDLVLDAHVPEGYVPDVQQRLSIYRRLSSVSDLETVAGLATEIEDRYGPLPPPVAGLVALARVKARASEAGVTLVRQIPGRIIVQANDTEAAGRYLESTGLLVRPIDPHTVHLILPTPMAPDGRAIDFLDRSA